MKKNALTFFAIIALAAGPLAAGPDRLPAQSTDVVKTEILLSKSAVHAGDTIQAGLRLTINPGWHINAHETTDQFMFASEFNVEDAAPFKIADITYPEPRKGKFEYSETELLIYEGEAVLGAMIETAKNAAPGVYNLKGTFAFQACDNRSCIPPKTINLDIAVRIVPDSEEVKEQNQDVFSKLVFKKNKKTTTP